MNEFKIRRGKVHDARGAEHDGWLVIDKQAVLDGSETIAGCVWDSDSGKALIRAMVSAGASLEVNTDLPG